MTSTEHSVRPVRVLHVLKYYRPDFSGEGIFLERSSAVMQELAPSVEHHLLVTHTIRPTDCTEAAACSTLPRIVYLSGRPLGPLARHLAMIMWFVLNLYRYHTIHFRTHVDWYFFTYLMARVAGRRIVLSATLDDSLPVLIRQYRPWLRTLAARGFKLFNAYVSISPKLQAETRLVVSDPARCHLIPCGVTITNQGPVVREAMRQRLGIGPDDPVLLFVGGLCERKDPLFLVEALSSLVPHHPRIRLLLVGPPLEPNYVARLETAIGDAGLSRSVVIAGEQIDPDPWFAAADILVFASRLEGFGTVVPEAMAHGLPVVVRRLPGVNDSFVLQGETGFLFDDAAGLITGIDRLVRDPALRRRIGEAGRRLAEDRFSGRKIAKRYLDVYGLGNHALPSSGADVETKLGCTASVHDPRFHEALAETADPPVLVTMVDAEEAFDWSGRFSRDAIDVSSMGSQHIAHRIFERHGVVPVYLTDYAVVSQDAGRAPLRDLLASGVCDIGAQMHPWVTPPFVEEVGERNSFAGNLPAALELEKARQLTFALCDAFGAAPLIYRTGRFGAGMRTADILKYLGYLADTSVAPCWPPEGSHPLARFRSWSMPKGPFWIDRERTLLEIPITASLVGTVSGKLGQTAAPFIFGPSVTRTGLPGILSRLHLLERIRLSPEGTTIDDAKRLTRHMLRAGHRIFVLTYHSPSLVPGNTPYTRSEKDVQRFLNWLDEYYAFFVEEVKGRPATWREVHQRARGVTAIPDRTVAVDRCDRLDSRGQRTSAPRRTLGAHPETN